MLRLHEDGGDPVRNMFVLLAWNVRTCCGRCTCRCLPHCPQVEAAAARAVLSVVVVVPVGVIDGPLRFGVTRLRFSVRDQKVGIGRCDGMCHAT